MLKKGTAALLIFAGLLTLCACSMMIEGEYSQVRRHQVVSPESQGSQDSDVTDIGGLKNALMEMVKGHREKRTIRFVTYDGNVEKDMADICMEVSKEEPLGAYAIYYINYNLNYIVSYYEAEISISYKKTPTQIGNVLEINSKEDIDRRLSQSLENFELSTAFLTDIQEVDADYMEKALEQAYYMSTTPLILMPQAQVNIYPDTDGAHQERVVEIIFTYPYIITDLTKMAQSQRNVVDRLTGGIEAEDTLSAVRQLYDTLSQHTKFDAAAAEIDNYSRDDTRYTAYGALVERRAASEGFAMAFKILCNELGIGCRVIVGRHNGINHAWNLLKIDGEYYHIDVSGIAAGGEEVYLLPSGELPASYWWDAESYDLEDGGQLSFAMEQ